MGVLTALCLTIWLPVKIPRLYQPAPRGDAPLVTQPIKGLRRQTYRFVPYCTLSATHSKPPAASTALTRIAAIKKSTTLEPIFTSWPRFLAASMGDELICGMV